jgi:hypothetical protein
MHSPLHIPDGMMFPVQFAAASLARYPKKEIEINNKQCEFILAFGIDKPRPPNRLYLRLTNRNKARRDREREEAIIPHTYSSTDGVQLQSTRIAAAWRLGHQILLDPLA